MHDDDCATNARDICDCRGVRLAARATAHEPTEVARIVARTGLPIRDVIDALAEGRTAADLGAA